MFGAVDQRVRVTLAIISILDDVVIADVIRYLLQTTRQQPHQRLKEQYCRGQTPQQMKQTIATRQVSQFV